MSALLLRVARAEAHLRADVREQQAAPTARRGGRRRAGSGHRRSDAAHSGGGERCGRRAGTTDPSRPGRGQEVRVRQAPCRAVPVSSAGEAAHSLRPLSRRASSSPPPLQEHAAGAGLAPVPAGASGARRRVAVPAGGAPGRRVAQVRALAAMGPPEGDASMFLQLCGCLGQGWSPAAGHISATSPARADLNRADPQRAVCRCAAVHPARRQACERALVSTIGRRYPFFFIGNAPMAHVELPKDGTALLLCCRVVQLLPSEPLVR